MTTTATAGTVPAHLDALREILASGDYTDDQTAPYWRMLSDLPTRPRGTMAAWFKARNGGAVDTLQVKRSGAPWLPGPRKVDASRASFVLLDGSRRDYAGTRVLGADDTTLVVHADPDGFDHVVVYRRARGTCTAVASFRADLERARDARAGQIGDPDAMATFGAAHERLIDAVREHVAATGCTDSH